MTMKFFRTLAFWFAPSLLSAALILLCWGVERAAAQGYNQMLPAGTLGNTDQVTIYRGAGHALTLAPLSDIWGGVPALNFDCPDSEFLVGIAAGTPGCDALAGSLGDALDSVTGASGGTLGTLMRAPSGYVLLGGPITVPTVAALDALTLPWADVHLLGWHTPDDGGGGNLAWNASSTAAPDGGTIFGSGSSGRWIRDIAGHPVNVKWFGAYGTARMRLETAFIAGAPTTTLVLANVTTLTAADYASGINLYFALGTTSSNEALFETQLASAPVSSTVTPTGTTANGSASITGVSSLTGVTVGFGISDSLGCVPDHDWVAVATGGSITLGIATNASGCGANDVLTVSGQTVTMATSATVNTTGPVDLIIGPDDSTAVQNAVNTAAALGIKKIWFPDGGYIVNNITNTSAPVEWIGPGVSYPNFNDRWYTWTFAGSNIFHTSLSQSVYQWSGSKTNGSGYTHLATWEVQPGSFSGVVPLHYPAVASCSSSTAPQVHDTFEVIAQLEAENSCSQENIYNNNGETFYGQIASTYNGDIGSWTFNRDWPYRTGTDPNWDAAKHLTNVQYPLSGVNGIFGDSSFIHGGLAQFEYTYNASTGTYGQAFTKIWAEDVIYGALFYGVAPGQFHVNFANIVPEATTAQQPVAGESGIDLKCDATHCPTGGDITLDNLPGTNVYDSVIKAEDGTSGLSVSIGEDNLVQWDQAQTGASAYYIASVPPGQQPNRLFVREPADYRYAYGAYPSAPTLGPDVATTNGIWLSAFVSGSSNPGDTVGITVTCISAPLGQSCPFSSHTVSPYTIQSGDGPSNIVTGVDGTITADATVTGANSCATGVSCLAVSQPNVANSRAPRSIFRC
jgi:hypothetical protein